jgi:hypothetical protein
MNREQRNLAAQGPGTEKEGPLRAHTTQRDWNDRIHLGRPWSEEWLHFEADMMRLGLQVHECYGAGWGGPAVTIPATQLAHIRRGTAVRLDSHEVSGGNIMVYAAVVWIGANGREEQAAY